jgi:hypothetical protein
LIALILIASGLLMVGGSGSRKQIGDELPITIFHRSVEYAGD